MVKINLIVLLVAVIFCGVVGSEIKQDEQETFSYKSFKSVLRSIGLKIFFDFSQCGQDIKTVYKAVKNKQLWAWKILDASSKLPPALLEGNLIGLGSSDECIEIQSKPDYGNITGKFCSAFIPIPESIGSRFHVDPEYLKKISVRWGVCIPSSCKAADLSHYLSPLTTKYNFTINFRDDRCYTKRGIPYSTLDYIALGALAFCIFLLILSTTYDNILDKRGLKPVSKILLAFSVKSNLKKLFKVQSVSKDRSIIHSVIGMRIFSLAWIIIGHAGLTLFISPMLNMKTVVDNVRSLKGQILVTAIFAVDTFLVISGLLVSYIIMRKFKNGVKFRHIPQMYIQRYLRLTPPYAAMILFQMSLAKHIYQGPMWDDVWQFWSGACSQYWWAALTYIQNYVNPGKVCLGQTWYLSVDMQLFFVAPFLLILFHKYRRLTYPVLTTLGLASMSIAFIIAYMYEIPAGSIQPKPDMRDALLYVPTHTRAGPWLVGLGLGYFFNHNKGRTIMIPKAIVITCWTITLTTFGALILGMWLLVQVDYVYNPFIDPFYLSFSRTAWGFGVTWMIIACENGYGGFITDLLSWKWFQPLARLSYCQYLVHSSYQRMLAGAHKTTKYINAFYLFTDFVNDYVMTLLLSLVLYLLIEAPIAKMNKIFIKDKVNENRPENMKQPNNKHV